MRKTTSKLALRRQTIAQLGDVQLAAVAGGQTAVVGGCEKTQLNCPTMHTCAAQGCLGPTI